MLIEVHACDEAGRRDPQFCIDGVEITERVMSALWLPGGRIVLDLIEFEGGQPKVVDGEVQKQKLSGIVKWANVSCLAIH